MSLTAILVFTCLAVGGVLFLFLQWGDAARKDLSLTNFLGSLSGVCGRTELLFVSLWPGWAAVRWWPRK
jgi:hypothetical protein